MTREAALQAALDALLALYPRAFCVLDRFETCGDPFCVETRANRDAILDRLAVDLDDIRVEVPG